MYLLSYILLLVISLPVVIALYLVFRLGLQGESYKSTSWYNRIRKFIGMK